MRPIAKLLVGIGLGIACLWSVKAEAALMAYWTFDQGTGTQLTDSSGRGNHGTLAGTTLPQWVAGHTGRAGDWALYFSGSTAQNDANAPHVFLGNLPDLTITGDQTISMWLYPTDFTYRQNPYAKAYGGTGTITQEPTTWGTPKSLDYYYGTAGSNSSPYQSVSSGSGGILIANQWNHIALVRDFTNNQIRWFVNGVCTNVVTPAYSSAAADNLDAYIGRGYERNYWGRIDDMAIFNHALPDVQVKAIASGELSPGTIGHYQTIRKDWLEGWLYRQPITISKNANQANLTGFPIPIQLTDSNNPLFAMANSPVGNDIIFTGADGKTVLPFEIESFSKASGSESLYAWVKTNLSSTEDTVIYMYYGGPSSVPLSYKETWDSNFRIVQHMEETQAPYTDSTSKNRNMLTGTNGAGTGTGIFGTGVTLGGYANPQYLVATGDSIPAASSFTIEGWAKITDDASTQNQYFFSIYNRAAPRAMVGGTPRLGMHWEYSVGGGRDWNSDPYINLADGNWHYVVQVYDASVNKMYLYQDGSLLATADVSGALSTGTTYYVGTWESGYGYLPGTFDEFRVSDVARSADWILANWNLIKNSQKFLQFGAQQYVPEPSTWSLAFLAFVGFGGLIWRKKWPVS